MSRGDATLPIVGTICFLIGIALVYYFPVGLSSETCKEIITTTTTMTTTVTNQPTHNGTILGTSSVQDERWDYITEYLIRDNLDNRVYKGSYTTRSGVEFKVGDVIAFTPSKLELVG